MGSLRVVRFLSLAGVALGCGVGRAPAPVVVIGSVPPATVPEAPSAPAPPPDPACPPSCIPDTEVPDTVDNRAVIAFCERYRAAVVARDVPLLFSFVSPRYYDDGGTPNGGDGIDRAALGAYLTQQFTNIEQVEYVLHYKRIVRTGATIRVECTLDSASKLAGNNQTWRRHHEENTIVLESTRGGFLILSGM